MELSRDERRQAHLEEKIQIKRLSGISAAYEGALYHLLKSLDSSSLALAASFSSINSQFVGSGASLK
jgi:hypothetical protein